MRYSLIQIIIITIFSITACSVDESEIKNTIRARLTDPDSAKFKTIVVSNLQNKACVVWNAKNRVGGYGSWQYTKLVNRGSSWAVSKLEEEPSYCTQSYYEAQDEYIIYSNKIMKLKGNSEQTRAIQSKIKELGSPDDLPESLIRNITEISKQYLDAF